MNCDVLSKGVEIPNLRSGNASFPFQILSFQPDSRKRINLILLPEFCVAINDDMRMENALWAEGHVFPDDAIRPDHRTLSDLGPRMHNSRGLNLEDGHGKAPDSTSLNVTSASLTGSESTEQIPFALPIFPRDLVNSTSIVSVSPGRTGLRHFTLSAAMK